MINTWTSYQTVEQSIQWQVLGINGVDHYLDTCGTPELQKYGCAIGS